jgi:hypothetical protein
MISALGMPATTRSEIAARNQAIASARSTQPAAAANKGLSPTVVSRVDHLLGLPATDPGLGVTR